MRARELLRKPLAAATAAAGRAGGAIVSALTFAMPQRMGLWQHFRRMERDPDYREAVFIGLRGMGYRAAKNKAGQTPWLGGSGDADANLCGDLPALRDRARELERDDPIGSGILWSFVVNVIGVGFRPQAITKDEAKNDRIEAFWKRRKDRLDLANDATHAEHQRMVLGRTFWDGELLAIESVTPEGEQYFELAEADRIQTPPGLKPAENIEVIDGVAKDKRTGIPLGCYVLKRHPGARAQTFTVDYTFVPKARCKHLKLKRPGRPGQTRGEPAAHAILQELRDLDLLILAALKRTQIAACLAAFIKTARSTDQVLPATATKYGYQLDQEIEPGMLFKLFPDEEIQTLIPNFPTPELESFIVMLCRRIGAALGVSWQIVLKDFSKSNYSSARTDLLEARGTYTILQSWLTESFLNWQWRAVMLDGFRRGEPELAGCTSEELEAVTWIAPGWRWVDPVKEAQGAQIELATGTTTLREICAQQGKDWQEVMRQRLREEKYEQDLRKELGLGPKVLPGAPAPQAEDDDEEEEEDDDAQAQAA